MFCALDSPLDLAKSIVLQLNENFLRNRLEPTGVLSFLGGSWGLMPVSPFVQTWVHVKGRLNIESAFSFNAIFMEILARYTSSWQRRWLEDADNTRAWLYYGDTMAENGVQLHYEHSHSALLSGIPVSIHTYARLNIGAPSTHPKPYGYKIEK